MGETKIDAKITRGEQEEVEADIEIWKYALGFTNMAVVKCALELQIADAVETINDGRPVTLSELSSSLGCSPSLLYRIMRFLLHLNFFKELKPTTPVNGAVVEGYVNNPLSRRLLRKGEKSMVDLILLESSHAMLGPWHNLSTRVTRGPTASPFVAANGVELWKYAEVHPEHSKLIDDAMACDSRMAVPAVVESCGDVFEGVETVVDVGGGNGTSLSLLVKACPWIKNAINFDLPHVVSAAPHFPGVRYVGGDMFQSIPKAEVIFIKAVLHDWNDEKCIKILKNCKEAIPKEKGKVIIIESVVVEDKLDQEIITSDERHGVRLMLDMVMLAHTNTGKERTSKEWDFIIGEAGFTHHFVKPTRYLQSVIVAFP